MSVKVSDIDDKHFAALGAFFKPLGTSEMKPDKTGFVQNRIFLLIINKICASTTKTNFSLFYSSNFLFLRIAHSSFTFFKLSGKMFIVVLH